MSITVYFSRVRPSFVMMKALFFSWLLIPLVASASMSEMQKIEALLAVVKSSDVIFIRNGKEYSAKDAHEHLQQKLGAAQSSLFAPAKDKWTAVLFIEEIASQSSMSRQPYFIREKDGKTVKAGLWLTDRLREIEAKDQPPLK